MKAPSVESVPLCFQRGSLIVCFVCFVQWPLLQLLQQRKTRLMKTKADQNNKAIDGSCASVLRDLRPEDPQFIHSPIQKETHSLFHLQCCKQCCQPFLFQTFVQFPLFAWVDLRSFSLDTKRLLTFIISFLSG